MASNYTENYKLPVWERGDEFLHEEFNETHEKIDAALAGLIVTGTYVGNATDSSRQTIELGFQPRFLLVRDPTSKGSTTSSGNNWTLAGLAVTFPGYYHYYNGSVPLVYITETGFTVGGSSNGYFNKEGTTYTYLAIR